MNPNFPARIPLAHLPTPLEKMDRLSRLLGGPELWIKRDDCTGLAFGGNKTRKLEYLIADAQKSGCDHLITMGAAQSNHCRQTAAAAAKVGMGCSLVLSGTAKPIDGNLLVSSLLGAKIYWAGDDVTSVVAAKIAKQQTALGKKPYIIPYGGSNVMGATSYVAAMQELVAQLDALDQNVDFIVMASSSGGTQAGLVLGAEVTKFNGRILGISVDNSAESLKTKVASLATATSTHLGLGLMPVAKRVEVNDDYQEAGYGIVTKAEQEAIQLVAQTEGILLDPVYSGRAMAGLIDLIRWGAFTRNQTILFWHTGGSPALFPYRSDLL